MLKDFSLTSLTAGFVAVLAGILLRFGSAFWGLIAGAPAMLAFPRGSR